MWIDYIRLLSRNLLNYLQFIHLRAAFNFAIQNYSQGPTVNHKRSDSSAPIMSSHPRQGMPGNPLSTEISSSHQDWQIALPKHFQLSPVHPPTSHLQFRHPELQPGPTVNHKRPDSSAPIMSSHSHQGMPGSSISTKSSSSPQGGIITIPQAPSSLETLPSALTNTSPPPLACPVSGCLLVLRGEMPHRYLKRHLKYPGLYGRVLEVGQANYVDIIKLVEDNKAEEERESRAAEFELRAKNMGMTDAKSVAQKVAIWEGMWVAKQKGDDIGVSTLYSASFGRL
ncbi:hypothetical protein B9Z19DRAFT_1166331 [Tuber borchii]|uniref:Uncharacterized protein n=1 Tax=Tuber borchii TaxID=42251 RepID=A0A2T6ZBI9_TUBBO|nr:hypothetical protein B9Z19DRAFT_1166331 [Tuber borchii]